MRACVRGRRPVAAAGAAVRVAMHLLFDTALMAPVRGWLARAERLLDGAGRDAGPRLARGRAQLRADADRRPRRARGSGLGAPSRSVRRCDPAAPPSDGSPRHGSLILDGDVAQGLALLDEAGVAHGLRRARSALDRSRLLRARVRAAGTRAVRPGRGVDRGDGAVVETERHRQPPRPLPGPPRRDPPAARVVPRGGAGGAPRVRGAAPVLATRARVAADRARTDPAAQGRHRGRGGGVARGPRAGWDPQPGLALVRLAQGDVARGGRVHPRRARAAARWCRRRSCHRTPTCGGRRCSRRRSRSGSRPATSTGRARPPTSSQLGRRPVPEQGAGRQRALATDGCGSPKAMRGRGEQPSPKRRGSGTRSAPRTRRRSRASGSPTRTVPSGSEHRADAGAPGGPRRSSTGSRTARGAARRAGRQRRAPARTRTSSVARATTGCGVRRPHGARPRPQGHAVPRPAPRRPRRELHVLDLVAAESRWRRGRARRDGRPSRRSATPARCSTPGQGGVPPASRRDRGGHRGGAGQGTPSARRRPRSNATSSSASCRAPSGSAVVTTSRSASERARAAVTRAVRQAMVRIGEHHPALGEHLDRDHPHRHVLRLPARPRAPVAWRF